MGKGKVENGRYGLLFGVVRGVRESQNDGGKSLGAWGIFSPTALQNCGDGC